MKFVIPFFVAFVVVAAEPPQAKTSSDSTENTTEKALLTKEKIESIKNELADRIKKDQEGRKDKKKMKEMAKVDRNNTKWLKEIIKEIGWIDVDRFGPDASYNAFLIVQHSGDLPLMQESLPQIEKDVRAKKLDSQAYALLYDRLNLCINGKQKYGSQIGMSKKGALTVLPLENADKVEEYRKEIGMRPLSQYLKTIEKAYGKKVIFQGQKGSGLD